LSISPGPSMLRGSPMPGIAGNREADTATSEPPISDG